MTMSTLFRVFYLMLCHAPLVRSIKRIIFNSLVKPNVNEKGEKHMETISTSQALQIAGRAGRFSSIFNEGQVTTMYRDDLVVLRDLLGHSVEPIKVRTGSRFFLSVRF